jgi:DNA-binding IclR family transcriptional regulator
MQRSAGRALDAASKMARLLAPALAQVSEGCGDASFAVVREGHSSWCVARHIGTYPIQILSVQVGSRQPLGVGAAGLAVLAALPEAEADEAIRSHGEVLARYGGMTAERMRLLVRASRERGWAVVGNHAVRGVLGVGRALLSSDGRALAGISVASEIGRMTPQRQRLIAGLMRDALSELVT